MQINLNQFVKIKLTVIGKRHLFERHNQIYGNLTASHHTIQSWKMSKDILDGSYGSCLERLENSCNTQAIIYHLSRL